MGDYLTHTVGGTPTELDEFLGTATLDKILIDLTVTADKQLAVEEAIDGAEGYLNSYLSGRYDVPIASPTKALKQATGALSVCNLYDRGRGAPEEVAERCEVWRRWVKDISMSKAHLVGADPQPAPPDGGSVAQSEANTRRLTRETLDWW